MISREMSARIRRVLLVVLSVSAPFLGHGELPPELPRPAFIFEYDLPPGPARPMADYPVIEYPVRSLPKPTRRPDPVPAADAPSAATAQTPAPTLPATAPTAPAEQAARLDPGPASKPSVAPVAAGGSGTEGATPSVELFARPGDPFSLYLEGETWLFTGASPNDSRVEYAGRSRSDSGIRFSFIARKIGILTLSFSRSGSQGRAVEERRVAVEIVAPDQFLARIGAAPAKDEPAGVEVEDDGSFEQVWEHIESGEYEKAYALLSSTVTFDGISATERSVALLLSAALRSDEVPLPTPEELGLNSMGARAEVELVDEVLARSRRLATERELVALRNSRKLLTGFAGIDALLFRLGELYQEPGTERDIERAIDYYTEIIELHPLSRYWEESRRRRVYLERHFLLLR